MARLPNGSTLHGSVMRTGSGGDGSPNSCCDDVGTPLLQLLYGLRLLSATRAFRVDCRVELIGVSLEEGKKLVLTSPASSSRRGATAGGASPILKKGW